MDRDSNGRFSKGNTLGGQSPGRPKKNLSIPDILRKIGDEPVIEDSEETRLERIMKVVMDQAEQGLPWAVQFIADRTEGKPTQSMSIETHEPLQLIKTGIAEFDDQ